MGNPVYKHILRFAFSHVGLFLILMLYCAAGALMFAKIEENKLAEAKIGANMSREIERMKNDLKSQIYAVVYAGGPEAVQGTAAPFKSYSEVKALLDNYQEKIKTAIANYSYQGVVVEDVDAFDKWTFASGALFCVSIITLIGYGHVTPVTQFGQFMVLPFALIGVPLTLMYLTNVGRLFAKALRLMYTKVLCKFLSKKRALKYDEYDEQHLVSANKAKLKDGATIKDGKIITEDVGSDNDATLTPVEVESVPVLVIAGVLCIYLSLGAGLFSFTEGWSFISAFYFCFVSLTTIGFGDLVPGYLTADQVVGQLKLLAASLYIIFGLGILGMCINIIVAQFIIKYRSIGRKIGVVESVDADGDGVDDGDEAVLRGMEVIGRGY